MQRIVRVVLLMVPLRVELLRAAVALCRAQVRRSCPLEWQLVFSLVGVLCWSQLVAVQFGHTKSAEFDRFFGKHLATLEGTQ